MSQTNNNFDELKRLLKLKQYEMPPPGYLNQFSDSVISRIRTGETGGSHTFIEQLQADSPFMSFFLQLVALKPGVVGALATSVCLLLLAGVLVVDHNEPAAITDAMALGAPASEVSPTLASADALQAANGGLTVSSNPASSLQPVTSLFGSSPQNPLFQPVSFTSSGQ